MRILKVIEIVGNMIVQNASLCVRVGGSAVLLGIYYLEMTEKDGGVLIDRRMYLIVERNAVLVYLTRYFH